MQIKVILSNLPGMGLQDFPNTYNKKKMSFRIAPSSTDTTPPKKNKTNPVNQLTLPHLKRADSPVWDS